MLVSVIIGTFNRALLLERAIHSVFSSEYSELEVIVIDDDSTDNTSGVLFRLKEMYGSALKVHRNSINMGISANSNLGFRMSKGRYIALLGDDDYWVDKHKIAKQVDHLNNNSRCGAVGSNWYELNDTEELIPRTPKKGKDLIRMVLEGGGIICGSTPLIKREAWLLAGGFDERRTKGTDSDLFRRIALVGYELQNIEDFTAVIDIGHGHRMTPLLNGASYAKAVKNQLLFISRYKWTLIAYPDIFRKRVFKMIKFMALSLIK
jgi:glycosyltransferase involved in cell wall biosynthesis